MTDSEKLDLILSEIQGIKGEIRDIKGEMQGIKGEIQVLKQKVDRLEVGQLEIKKEQYMINRQIADTYKLALDAWGQGVENRSWLENGALSV